MKIQIQIALVGLLLALGIFVRPAESAENKFRIIKVSDGDTITYAQKDTDRYGQALVLLSSVLGRCSKNCCLRQG